MRPTRTAALLTAGLVTVLGLPAASTAAAADTPLSLYVNNLDGSGCSDTGAGSRTAPFCTIAAAARVVQPGQTVRITPGKRYTGAVTLDRSGEPGKPITFAAESLPGVPGAELAASFTLTGVSHVAITGLGVFGGVQVNRAHHVELDRIKAVRGTLTGLVVGDGSTNVRVTRSEVREARIEGGARGTLLGRNVLGGGLRPALAVTDAPDTVVTNNTLDGACPAILSVSGASTGAALFNNVVNPRWDARCDPAVTPAAIEVTRSAAAGARADHNLIHGLRQGANVKYRWAGTDHQTPAALRAATGQGAHDVLTPSDEIGDQMDASPAVDSADATAPGVLPTSIEGVPTSDNPNTPNTGTDGGYLDRGAYEMHDHLTEVRVSADNTWAPVGTTVEVRAGSDSRWSGEVTYHYDFGDGTAPVVTQGHSARHVYTAPCACVMRVTAVNRAGTKASTEQTVRANPDTPLTAGFTTGPELPTSDSPVSSVRPLTLRVDTAATAAPWPVRSARVDFGDGHAADTMPGDTVVRHTYDRPGTYTVALTVRDSAGAESTTGRSVKVDYAPSGYLAAAPFRLLDTRTTGTPLRGGQATPVTLPVGLAVPDHPLSGSMAAAVLNVTVTGATEDTHLSVWPSGQPRPVTSNVNVRAGGTSSNTVTVPVGADGRISAQLNSGQAALVVDFAGYYQPGAGQRFTPVAPTRVSDTRAAGGPLGADRTRTVKVAGVNGIPADATAVALNLTSTGATESSHVIAYPDPAKRPTTSNLNPEPGRDKSNQAIVPVGPNGTITLYTNTGSTHLVLDAVGYYAKNGSALFTPAAPKRLADTRTTGTLAPGATTTVAGLPANAVGAVLNVTATDSTGPGFLTVYGQGAARPDASSLNTRPGDTVPNHVTTPVNNGRVDIWNSYGGSTHVVTDLLGCFTQG
ncbi:PKD domain-containing protein [Streptomyces sp. NPDC058662]|uniref:PKD domain-containing protein n=1 Tax=Streptomyces sp. NPDC058662 TaxID=3346583 RepID=UPI0036630C1B